MSPIEHRSTLSNQLTNRRQAALPCHRLFVAVETFSQREIEASEKELAEANRRLSAMDPTGAEYNDLAGQALLLAEQIDELRFCIRMCRTHAERDV